MNRKKVSAFLISILIIMSGATARAGENEINALADYYRGIKPKEQVNNFANISDVEKLLAKEKAKDAENTNDVASYFVFTPETGTASVFVGAQWFIKHRYADTETNTKLHKYINVVFGVRATEFAADESSGCCLSFRL